MDSEGCGIGAIVGRSPWAEQIRIDILRVADGCSSVLIVGPTGTGKELIARAIHAHSRRAQGPFVPVDCAAVTGSLFASHLFGYVKGAFTGANHDASGCFRAAHGGTIFLDEIGELELELQANLLRVLQQRTVTPVGSHEEIPIDVRVLAATNREPSERVSSGLFREDLYYRLNVIMLRTMPLKQRPEDLPDLARRILARLAARDGGSAKQVSDRCLDCLARYDWPGNVRELENLLERAAVLTPGDVLEPEDLKQAPGAPCEAILSLNRHDHQCVPSKNGECRRPILQPWPTLADVEREHILQTLQRTGYNQTAAACLLELDRHQLARRIKKFGLDSTARRGRPPKEREKEE